MKKTVLALSLLALLGTSPIMSQTHQPRHRHQPRTEQVANDNDKGNENKEANKEADNANNDGKATADENVAFSDTTSVTTYSFDEANSTDDANAAVNDSPLNFSHYDNPFAWFATLFTAGFGGIVLALLVIVVVFTFIFAPFIILFMILRYLMRRHNDRVELAEKAMEAGVDVPEHLRPVSRQSDDYMWRKGVKNASIGFGLMVIFFFWDIRFFAGIGGFVLCYGIGQMLIARTSNGKGNNDPNDPNAPNSFNDPNNSVGGTPNS